MAVAVAWYADRMMQRRTFLHLSLGSLLTTPLWAAVAQERLESAAAILDRAVDEDGLAAASLLVRQGGRTFARCFGAATSIDDVFLLASISKPISVAALMTLYDQGRFRLDDPVQKFLPEFTGEGRQQATVAHLLTHTSGLPDQLPDNQTLRSRHAPLSEFVAGALKTPLLFAPGTQYRYSSMGILLATEIAHRVQGAPFAKWIDQAVFEPLGMTRSALGLGRLRLEQTMRCQVEQAAPESGAGDPAAASWDWNSPYWRSLGSPWGGVHASAVDVARFFDAFLHPDGTALQPETARLMLRNHNPAGLTPRGLGFGIGTGAGSPGCSPQTFGHTGSTGTLAWADPARDTVLVVLTTLPASAADPHPRQRVSDQIADA